MSNVSNSPFNITMLIDPADMLSGEQLQKVLPKSLKGSVTQDMLDKVNALLTDSELAQNYRDNIIGFSSVLNDGKYKIEDYLNAVRYVSFRLLGSTQSDAYIKTFPERYDKFIREGKDAKTISSYVHAYNNNKLVASIYEQSMVPTWIVNAELYQKAINTQAELMVSAQSEKVRCDAADSILNHLKRPEVQRIDVNMNTNAENSVIDELRETTRKLVEQQKAMLQAGALTIEGVAGSKIIQGDSEVIDVN